MRDALFLCGKQAPRRAPRYIQPPNAMLYKNEPCLTLRPCNDPLTTLMASDTSAYPLSHDFSGTVPHTPKNMTPAQAIAEAWQRESVESKQQWRAVDARKKEQYYAPHPWTPTRTRLGPKM